MILLVFQACSDRGETQAKKVVQLFDGETLSGWKILGFEGTGGRAFVEDGILQIDAGDPISGIALDDPNLRLPQGDYVVELEAKIVDGDDFFCGLTFPIPSQGTCCTLVVGGWGGTLVGISNINGMDAAHNHLSTGMNFEPRRWYKIQVRVASASVVASIDGVPLVQISGDKQFSMRPGPIEACQPIGLATYKTSAAFRNFTLQEL